VTHREMAPALVESTVLGSWRIIGQAGRGGHGRGLPERLRAQASASSTARSICSALYSECDPLPAPLNS